MGAHVFCLSASLPLHFHVSAGGMCSGLRVTRLASLRPKHIRPCERDDVGQYASASYEAKCDCVFRHLRFIFLSPHRGNTQHHSHLFIYFLACLFSSNRSLLVPLVLSERMPWDCAWVRTGDSSQRTTFLCWIKRLIRARHVIQSVFHCYPMRSIQKIKDVLISEEA